MKFLAACACLLAAGVAHAQTWPTKPVTIVYGSAAGGPTDLMTRVIGAQIEKRTGQRVIAESRPGGGTTLAMAYVARATPDGHTLLLGGAPASTIFIKDLTFDPFKDLAPVSIVGVQYYVLLASRAMNVRTLKDFANYAKTNPGKLTVGMVPAGRHEIELNAMLEALRVTGNLIGYKGLAPIYTALMVGEINSTLGQTPPQLKTGEIVGLAIGGERRNPLYPDIPTFREAGFPYDPHVEFTLMAPGATPRDIVNKISAEAAAAAQSPEFFDKVTKGLTIEGLGSTPEYAVKILREDYDKQKRIADRVGIKAQ